MKTGVAYFWEPKGNDRVGIYVAEAVIGGKGLPGRGQFRKNRTVVFAVMCRRRETVPTGAEPESRAQPEAETVSRLQDEFARWFQEDFPDMSDEASTEVIKCCWRTILYRFLPEPMERWDLAVFLAGGGRYLFCGLGEFCVYEYTCYGKVRPGGRRHGMGGRGRRGDFVGSPWYTCRERQRLDRELGADDGEPTEIYFQQRALSGHTLFLILSGEEAPGNIQRIKNQDQLQHFVDGFRGRMSGAIAFSQTVPGERPHVGAVSARAIGAAK